MEVVTPDQLPALSIGKDYGYRVIVKGVYPGREQMVTWNGEVYCPTVIDRKDLPGDSDIGSRWFVGETEYEWVGWGMDWMPVARLGESNDLGESTEDIVNHPSHYTRGPKIKVLQDSSRNPVERVLECIEVIRWIKDMRLATATKYVWRVAFGGKAYGGMTLQESMRKDIEKAIFYLNDWLENHVN